MALVFGFGWGLAVIGAVIFANQNYAQVRALVDSGGNAPIIVLAVAGAVALSLLIFAVMVVSGGLQSLAGRRMPTRWSIVIGFLLGGATASLAVRMLEVSA